MRTLMLIFSCLFSISLPAQVKSVKAILCSHSWQEVHTSSVWSFQDSGHFLVILFRGKNKKFGFTAKKGTFNLVDSAKTIEVSFDSTYTAYSKDSFSVSGDVGLQVWNLITVTDSKMIISRPPIWEFEKQATRNGKNITATLAIAKKQRKGKKGKI